MDRLRVNSFGRSAAHDVAVTEGFYVAENLEVEHATTQSSKAQMQELVDGVWDIVHTNADNVFWWVEDNAADLVIVEATPGTAGQDLVVRAEITRYEELRGKPLAVDAAESGYATPLRLLLRQGGLASEGTDYTFVEVGATQQRIDSLRDGRAFGAMIGRGQADSLRAEGFRVLDSINRLYRHYCGSTVVRRRWAEEHSDLLVRYLRASIRSTALGEAPTPPPFDWDGLQEMLEMRRDLGMLRGPVDPRRFADDSYSARAIETLATAGSR